MTDTLPCGCTKHSRCVRHLTERIKEMQAWQRQNTAVMGTIERAQQKVHAAHERMVERKVLQLLNQAGDE